VGSSPGTIHAGTSGYSYREWKGTLFPADLPAERFLSFYSGKFTSVEINNTFYQFPSQRVLEQWAAETPPGFTFAVKANQRITHIYRFKNVQEITASFVQRCRALGERLGPILFQCPPAFRRDHDRLAGFLESLPAGGRYAIEFRHPSWFEQPVYDQLARAGVALVQSEDEKLESPRIATAGFCYVRLRKDGYTKTTLQHWRRWIDRQCQDGRDVFVYLKHDQAGASPEPLLRSLSS
jgi:uncharacterized protein YecE (DUF72 family)